jgi:2-methylisocitrate lyase-like PEP mutase family enzyme
VTTLEQVEAIHAATSLPLAINSTPAPAQTLIDNGVRLLLTGHTAYFAMLRALYDAFETLRSGGSLRDRVLSPELQSIALAEADYAAWAKQYLS